MASFPTAVISFATKNPGDVIPSADWNSQNAEITAIEDGYLNGTARLNSSHSTLATLSVTGASTLATLQAGASTLTSLSVTGGSTIASSFTLGTIPYIFPSSGGSTGQVLTCVSTSGSTMSLEWRSPTGALTLLHAASGTDSNAAAANVDTYAVSALTALDSLLVIYTVETVTQGTNGIGLYNNTDSVTLQTGLNLASGVVNGGQAIIGPRQGSATAIGTQVTAIDSTGVAHNEYKTTTFTTNWTGSWTLALRHTGVTAGGTFKYVWKVYKQAGQ